MIFGIETLVSYISQFMSLQAGTSSRPGTPAVGSIGIKPSPVYLPGGDEPRAGIDGLGEQRQRCVSSN
jgi:2-keto-4-pentenoate hydratase/2-oxohepta-3-ene-1,7-dioic acid hydratase in catechol pathway